MRNSGEKSKTIVVCTKRIIRVAGKMIAVRRNRICSISNRIRSRWLQKSLILQSGPFLEVTSNIYILVF